MKKVWSFLLISCLVISSCGAPADEAPPSGEDAVAFEWSKELAEDYLLETPASDIVSAHPFYMGSFQGFDNTTKSFMEERNAFVMSLRDVLGEGAENAYHLEQDMRDLRNLVDWYLLNVLANYPELEEELGGQMDEQNAIALMNMAQVNMLQGMKEELQSTEFSLKQAIMMKTMMLQELQLADGYHHELESLQALMLVTVAITEVLEDKEMTYLNAETDRLAEEITTRAGEELSRLHFNNKAVQDAMATLEEADRFYAEDMLAFVKRETKNLEDYITFHQTESTLSARELGFIEDMLQESNERMQVLENLLGSGDAVGFIPTAHAAEGWFDRLKNKVSSAASNLKEATKDAASYTWGKTKQGLSKVKDVVVDAAVTTGTVAKDVVLGQVKRTGQIIGAGLEIANAEVKTVMDVGFAVYEGVPPKEIIGMVKDNFNTMVKNIKDGRGGAQVFTTAKEYMEGVEDGAMNLVNDTVAAGIGEGVTSKTLGFIAKTTVGFFTGLAKDSYDVLNPDSSDLDRGMGLFGLALTAVGGTTSVAKPKDLIETGVKSSVSLLDDAARIGNSLRPSNLAKGLDDLAEKGFKKSMSDLFSSKTGNALKETLESGYEKGKNLIKDNLSKGYEGVKSNLKDVPKNFKGLFDDKSTLEILDDVFGTTGDDATAWLTGYLETVLNSATDDLVKDVVKNQFSDDKNSVKKTISTEKGDTIKKEIQESNDGYVVNKKEEEKEPTPEPEEETETEVVAEAEVLEEEEPEPVAVEEEEEASLEDAVIPSNDPRTILGEYTFSTTVEGLTVNGTGAISFTIIGGDVTCTSNVSQTMSGVIQGYPISGTGAASSSGCSGTIDAGGAMSGSGTFSGWGSVSIQGQTGSGSGSTGFTFSGVEDNGRFKGSLEVEGISVSVN